MGGARLPLRNQGGSLSEVGHVSSSGPEREGKRHVLMGRRESRAGSVIL